MRIPRKPNESRRVRSEAPPETQRPHGKIATVRVPRNSSAAQAGERAIELVDIDAGSVVLRDDRIGRIWRVEIQPFRIARCPVTCAQYRELLGLAPSTDNDAQPQKDSDALPVVEVSWYEAIAFCNALSAQCGLPPCYTLSDEGTQVTFSTESDGYRLPSEAEWQYACQAGDERVRYGELDAIAWYRENSGGQRHPVGQKQPNRWGLHDLLGNVWEWCWDLYDPQVYGEYRVFRGGGWADAHWGCTAASRRRSHPTFRIDDLGFRLARSGPASPAQRSAEISEANDEPSEGTRPQPTRKAKS